MRYGLPYKGSKNKIAEWVVGILPESDTLVDLFAGGCAITDCAMRSGKWNNFIINDIEAGVTQLFLDAIHGKYANEDRWISREMFFLLKESDPYIKYCWSFGNKGRDYLYGTDIEPYKEAVHTLIYENGISNRRRAYGRAIKELGRYLQQKQVALNPHNESHHGLQSLERLERLQSLECLERLQSLERYSTDYQQVPIPENATIYCDIPYRGTDKYNNQEFDYDRFYDWAVKQKNIYISEYSMPEDRFEVVAQRIKAVNVSAKVTGHAIEKIYKPR